MSTVSPRRVLLMVSMLHGASHLYTTFLQPLNADLRAFFGLTLDQEVTRIPAVYFICYATANLFSGVLVSRVAPRTLLALGPIVNGLAVMGMYFLQPHQYLGMLLLNGLGALGGGLYHPVGNLLLSETFPQERGKALGVSGVGASLAFIFAPLTASQLVHNQLCSWQTVCLLFGMIGVLCGIAALLLLPTGERKQATEAQNTSSADRALETRAVLLFAGLMILVTSGREIASWGVTAITQQFTAATYSQPVDAGLLLALIFVPGIFIQPLAGRWSDIIGRERVLCGAFLLAVFSLILLPLVPRSLIYFPYMFFGATMLATVPTTEALMADRSPPRLRGLIFGIVITAAFGTGSLGPLIAGAVADAGERTPEAYRWAFWVLSIFGLLSFLAGLLTKPLARRLKVTKFDQSPAQPPLHPV